MERVAQAVRRGGLTQSDKTPVRVILSVVITAVPYDGAGGGQEL